MRGTYNPWLVTLSIVVATLVSYTALKLASRYAESDRRMAQVWLVGGALAMGIGIWSMHFIGMLAYTLPIQLLYDIPTTLLSLLIAILSGGLAIFIAGGRQLSLPQLAAGGLCLGAGICAMHYTGMAAIDVIPAIRYDPQAVALSALVAVSASMAALWLGFHLRSGRSTARLLAQLGAAVVLGLAISGMHYVGMLASSFPANAWCRSGAALNNQWLAISTAIIALGILAVTLVSDLYSAELSLRSRDHATRLERANADLQHRATHDALTGLPNRELFFDRLEHCIAQGRRAGRRFAFMVVDLDRFKLVNDTLGHAVGDQLLVEVSRRLQRTLRVVDTVARVGGDEFFVILDDLKHRAEALQIGRKLLSVLSAPVRLDAHETQTSPSIGIVFYPDDASDADALLARADEAMYCAKQRGGNDLQTYSHDTGSHLQRRLQLEVELRQALPQGQFELLYQPKVDVFTGRVGSVEALLRWNHPTKSLMLPEAFLPIAEQTGLILPIGEWVLDQACRQARLWQRSGLALRVSVNISPVQFRHPGLLETIRTVLTAHQLPAELLELELNESAVMSHGADSRQTLEALSRMGVVISVDDFGTAYSSMSYLRQYPIDKLKIDSRFVRDLGPDNDSAHVVRAIIALAHSLKMKVIAEGVEQDEQLSRLKSLGCDQCQGFLFSVPAPAADIEALIRSSRGGFLAGSRDNRTVSRLFVPPRAVPP